MTTTLPTMLPAASLLRVYTDADPTAPLLETTDGARIAEELAVLGVQFERWSAVVELPADADDATVIAAYAPEIERLKAAGGYVTVDVVRLAAGTPNTAPMRAKFLDEHAHAEDEVRFFVEGRGAFYLHANDRVYQTICVRGDLISVPAGTKHWFDMGAEPAFTAIRLFIEPAGWVANFTGDTIASRFPTLD
jgi:1,2-dihydroxy-3-keto-5-methylthiopentene dioxygenase